MKVSLFSDIDHIPEKFRRIMGLEIQGNMFLTLDWFTCLARFGMHSDMIPRIYAVEDNSGAPLAIMLFCHRKGQTSLQSLTNFYTMEYFPVLAPGVDGLAGLLARIAQTIAEESPSWRSVNFRNVHEDASKSGVLRAAFEAAGFYVEEHFQFDNWYVPAAGLSFDEYYAKRPSRLKNTIKRREKSARKAHALSIVVHQNEVALDKGIADYQKIYMKSWKSEEQFPLFMENFIRICARLGTLRLGVLYVDNAPAAAQVWITTRKRSVIYKLAYDERYAKLSVGSILTRDMVKHAIDIDQVPEIDYGIGSEPYKQDWMTDCRHLHGMTAYNKRTLSGLVLGLANQLKSRLMRGGQAPAVDAVRAGAFPPRRGAPAGGAGNSTNFQAVKFRT